MALHDRSAQEISKAAGPSSTLKWGARVSFYCWTSSVGLQCAVWGLEVPSGQLHRLICRSRFVAWEPVIFLAMDHGDSATGEAIPAVQPRTRLVFAHVCSSRVCTVLG